MVTVRRVQDLPNIDGLVAASVGEGLVFVERLRNDWVSGLNRFDDAGEALFEARDQSMLVGICGLNRDPFLDDRTIGRLRHLYVLPSHRRRGIGRELVRAALNSARPSFHVVRLRTDDAGASLLYQQLGFRQAVHATHATHVVELPGGRGTQA